MSLNALTKDQIISLQSTAYASYSSNPARDGVGEPLGDIWFATAMAILSLNQNISYLDAKSRFLTSTGLDLDSFGSVFGVLRDTATSSVGQVSVTPISAPATPVFVLFGTTFSTATGLQFQVIPGTGSTSAGYFIPQGSSSPISVWVQCITPGSIGNVAANTITQVSNTLASATSSSANISVTNENAFYNGADGETDDAYKARFQQVIQSGRWGTLLGVASAIQSAGSNIVFNIAEGYNGGTATPGYFTVYLNTYGNSGSVDAITLANVKNAIAPIKACGVIYSVLSPTMTSITVVATLGTTKAYQATPGYTNSVIQNNAVAAVSNYVNSLSTANIAGTLATCSYAAISAALIGVPGVVSVTSLTINGVTADVSLSDLAHMFYSATVAGGFTIPTPSY